MTATNLVQAEVGVQVHVTKSAFSVHTRHPARRVCTAILITFAFSFAGFTTACGSSSSALPEPLANALTVMQESGGYSFTATIDTGSSSVTTSGDFQAPNRIAQTVTRNGATPIAMILDGATVYVQDPASGLWTSKASTTDTAVDLRGTFAALMSPKSLNERDGVYSFTLSESDSKTLAGSDASGTAKVNASIGEIGLSQLTYEVTAKGQPITVTISYQNIGNSPQVTIPA